MSEAERIWGVRGAVQVDRNDADSILAATRELLDELTARNRLDADRLVSIIFT